MTLVYFEGTQNATSCLKLVEFSIEDTGEVSNVFYIAN
jgi:hypothetical protein